MQKSVFLLWYIESFSAIESENLEFQNSLYERSTHAQLPRMIN